MWISHTNTIAFTSNMKMILVTNASKENRGTICMPWKLVTQLVVFFFCFWNCLHAVKVRIHTNYVCVQNIYAHRDFCHGNTHKQKQWKNSTPKNTSKRKLFVFIYLYIGEALGFAHTVRTSMSIQQLCEWVCVKPN